MDFISNIPKAVEMASQLYGDYNRGKQMRLGSYNGAKETKQVGHYNSKTGKRLAIYHGSA